MYKIIQKRKIWLSISIILVVLSLGALWKWGVKLGVDFTGGSFLEVNYLTARPSVSETQDALSGLELGSVTVQPVGESGMILRFVNVSDDQRKEVLAKLDEASAKAAGEGEGAAEEGAPNVEELRFDSVGPTIGRELARKSFNATIFVLLGIIIYIAYSFRKVSRPVASWKYGSAAILALIHDALIVLGAFSVLGHFYNIEVNSPFIAAILTVIGFSVHDTIVVFDRVRENLPKSNEDFESTVNTSLNQTITRSIITSGTVLLVLMSIYLYGGTSIRDFTLALLIGIFFGTYSSIFLASPILVFWEKMKKG